MKIFLLALSFNITLFGMSQDDERLVNTQTQSFVQRIDLYRCCPDSFGYVVKVPTLPRSQAQTIDLLYRMENCERDTFTRYLCSAEQTEHFDDEFPGVTIQKDLFKRMLLYVNSQNKGKPHARLIANRIADRLIDMNAAQVKITAKDWLCRLLAHLPWNGVNSHNTCCPLLIQDKVIFIRLAPCVHRAREITICDEHARLATPLTDNDQIEQDFNNLLLIKLG